MLYEPEEETELTPLEDVPVCEECGQPLEDGRWCTNPDCFMFIPF